MKKYIDTVCKVYSELPQEFYKNRYYSENFGRKIIRIKKENFLLSEHYKSSLPTKELIKKLEQKSELYKIINKVVLDDNWDKDKKICQGITIFITFIELNKDRFNDLIKFMGSFGYFKSQQYFIKERQMEVFRFEPYKYDGYNSNYLLPHIKRLYHITPKYIGEKIIRKGFIPKQTKNPFYDYPEERTFFFFNPNLKLYQSIINSEKDKSLSDKNKVNKVFKYGAAIGSSLEYYVFSIDVEKLNENIEFHIDQNCDKKGVFTYEYIPTSVIDSIMCINLDTNNMTKIK